ncbi:hypothetical protein M513_03872 [Trichuris suis]|uniref:Uncharacterized protein n=1 Tax=Trichuris suis TaxID=68888 RepID=A0A085MDD5_9BILA|nr:hypothetical protein M513_03872 [Trichuris suis]
MPNGFSAKFFFVYTIRDPSALLMIGKSNFPKFELRSSIPSCFRECPHLLNKALHWTIQLLLCVPRSRGIRLRDLKAHPSDLVYSVDSQTRSANKSVHFVYGGSLLKA